MIVMIERRLVYFVARVLLSPCWAMYLCMDHCWHSFVMTDLLLGHMEDLTAFAYFYALWNTCRTMRRQGTPVAQLSRFKASDASGGIALVSFDIACAGSKMWELILFEHDTVLSLKQEIAVRAGHLPFAIKFLVGGDIAPFATDSRLMRVVLNARTNERRSILPPNA